MKIRRIILSLAFFCLLYQSAECGVRRRRQLPQIPGPIANGELITSIFQIPIEILKNVRDLIPIQTLGAVRDLLQSTRGRLQAVGQAYQSLQAAHPNHRPNPHFTYDRFGGGSNNLHSNSNNLHSNSNLQSGNYAVYSYYNNRRRGHNSKALVQPRDNSINDQSSE
ncbi:Hypothetical protein NTJ_11789 [Nesidiocoris tenuis]|uniref:F-box domain-containing protein n=1 Tax=Nesidiocoris tenuis TaxID=355587 RepID=A0ABN7B444_9HEMI|nr:Hypothetical protein NTJ_11789 [Nesidiocoris tenuis]